MNAALGFIALLAAVIGLGTYLDSASCHSTANALGVPATWGPLQDCVIEYAPGKRIPLKNYRATEIAP